MFKELNKILSLFLVMAGLSYPLFTWGAMSSTNYYIYADSVNVGGLYSSGGAYTLEDTLGELAPGTVSSGSYTINGGYQAMNLATISMTLSTSTLNLGTLLSTAEVKQASTTVGIATDSETGYTLSATDVTGTHLQDVSDGTVSGDGTEEYGFAAAGADSLISNDTAMTAPKNISSTSTYTETTRETMLTFKAARAVTSTIGSYTQNITLTGSTNF